MGSICGKETLYTSPSQRFLKSREPLSRLIWKRRISFIYIWNIKILIPVHENSLKLLSTIFNHIEIHVWPIDIAREYKKNVEFYELVKISAAYRVAKKIKKNKTGTDLGPMEQWEQWFFLARCWPLSAHCGSQSNKKETNFIPRFKNKKMLISGSEKFLFFSHICPFVLKFQTLLFFPLRIMENKKKEKSKTNFILSGNVYTFYWKQFFLETLFL